MHRQIELPTLTLGATLGGTVTSYAPVRGDILAVRLVQSAGTAGMLTTVASVRGAETVLTVGAGSSGWWRPRAPTCTFGGTSLYYSGSAPVCEPFAVAGDYVQCAVTGGSAVGDTVATTLIVES